MLKCKKIKYKVYKIYAYKYILIYMHIQLFLFL